MPSTSGLRSNIAWAEVASGSQPKAGSSCPQPATESECGIQPTGGSSSTSTQQPDTIRPTAETVPMQPMDTPTPPIVILAEEPAARPSGPSSSRSTAQDDEPPADHPLADAATSNSDNSENVDLTVTDTAILAEAHSHHQEL